MSSIGRDRIESAIRRALDRLSEIERIMWEELIDSMREFEEILDDRYTSLARRATEPLYSFMDRGEWIIIVIDMPGSDPGSIHVELSSDRVRVSSIVRRDALERAFHGLQWASRIERYSGEIELPAQIDPSTAVIERRGSTIIIRARRI